MKKILKTSLMLYAILCCTCMFATTWKVNEPGDEGGNKFDVTLRWAISQAQPGDTIEFDQGVDIITLTQGAIPIDKSITIDGNGQTITTTASERVFYIFTTTGTTTFKNLTINGGNISNYHGAGILLQSGNLVLDEVTVQNGTAAQGGGIYVNNGGALSINNSSIRNNSATNCGGGIYADGTITINNRSLVNNNTATICGGGIYINNGATVTIQHGTDAAPCVRGNVAYQSGGGVYVNNGGVFNGISFYTDGNQATCNGGGICINTTGRAVITNSVISNNTAQNGGGVFSISSQEVTITKNSTGITQITSNTAANNGGGIYVGKDGILNLDSALVGQDDSIAGTGPNKANNGAGIFVDSGTVSAQDNSRISGNQATNDGGGIYIEENGIVNLNPGCLVGKNYANPPGGASNTAGAYGGGVCVYTGGQFTVDHSLICQNTAGMGGGGIAIFDENTPSQSKVSIQDGSLIDDNRADSWGGGIYVNEFDTVRSANQYNLTVTNSNVSYNTAATKGAGICSIMGKVNLNQVAIYHNEFTSDTYCAGAGIDNEGGDVNILRSTIAYNVSSQDPTNHGGGISNGDWYGTKGSCIVVMSTIYGNESGAM